MKGIAVMLGAALVIATLGLEVWARSVRAAHGVRAPMGTRSAMPAALVGTWRASGLIVVFSKNGTGADGSSFDAPAGRWRFEGDTAKFWRDGNSGEPDFVYRWRLFDEKTLSLKYPTGETVIYHKVS